MRQRFLDVSDGCNGSLSVLLMQLSHAPASMRRLREPQRRSLPPATAGGSGVRLPGGGSVDYYLFTALQGAWQPPRLELSDPPAQPSHDHVPTWALSFPHRSRDGRRHQR